MRYHSNRPANHGLPALEGAFTIVGAFLLLALILGATGVLNGETRDDKAEVTAGGQVLVDVLANDSIEGDITVEVFPTPKGVWVTVTDDGLLIDVSDYKGYGDFSVLYRAKGQDETTGERERGLGRVDVHVNAPQEPVDSLSDDS